MGTKIILPIIFGIIFLGSIGVVSQSYAQTETPQNKICDNETITSGIFKSITVIPGSICALADVEVTGNIIAENAIHLGVGRSIVGGNIIVNSIDSFDLVSSTITKNVKINGNVEYIQIYDSVIGKNLVIKNVSTLVSLDMLDNQISNNFVLKNNNYLLDGFDSNETYIVYNEIFGNVQIKNNVNFADLLFGANSVGKNTNVVDNIGDANFGDLNVSSNQVLSGNMKIKNNIADVLQSTGNIVDKTLKISKNDVGAIIVNSNTVNKILDVSGHKDLSFFGIESNVANKIKINSRWESNSI